MQWYKKPFKITFCLFTLSVLRNGKEMYISCHIIYSICYILHDIIIYIMLESVIINNYPTPFIIINKNVCQYELGINAYVSYGYVKVEWSVYFIPLTTLLNFKCWWCFLLIKI